MSDVNTYTLDANGLLYYLVDILPPAAAAVFRDALNGTAVIQLPTIAAAESLYIVRNRDQIAGHSLRATPDDIVDGLDSYLPVTVVDAGLPDLQALLAWMDTFPRQVHDGLVIASHETNDTVAIITRDEKIQDHVPTVWE